MPLARIRSSQLRHLSPVLLLCLIAVPSVARATSLVQLQLVFRHGVRNPLRLLPNDPYAYRYNTSLGQLTPAGVRQMRELGQFVRTHYLEQRVLPDHYDPREVWAYSTATDRTLASGKAFLSGLFAANCSGIRSKNGSRICEQQALVPLHSMPRETDILKPTSYTCPARDRLIKAATTGAAYRAEEARTRDLLSRLASATGKAAFSLSDAWTLGSSAQMWLGMGLRLPDWLSGADYQRLQLMRLRKYEMKFDDNPAVRKFCGGPLLDKMLSSARAKLSSISGTASKDPGLSLLVYSAHDSTVASLASALGIGVSGLGSVPPPAALLSMEVYSDATVRFVYRNSTEHRPWLLSPPACGKADCQLDRMSPSLFPSLGAVNLAYECSKGQGDFLLSIVHRGMGPPLMLLLTLATGVCLACAALFLGRRFCRRRKSNALRTPSASRRPNGDYAYTPLVNSAGEAGDDEDDENAKL